MKTYSIGRDLTCDIVIDDSTDVISRRHAVLKVEDNGTMTITDISSNGTYINGIRMNSNEPVPVTRKDTVSFAKVSNLDWNRIPAPAKKKNFLLITIIALVVIAGVICVILFSNKGSNDNSAIVASDSITNSIDSLSAPVDSLSVPADSIVAPVDSLNNDKAKADSLEKKDDKAKAKEGKGRDKKASDKNADKDKKDAESAKKDSTSVSKRAIG